MMRLTPFALAAATLGATLVGCFPIPDPTPPATTGSTIGATVGATGTSGTSGSTTNGGSSGTSGASSCFGLNESACLARQDCEPVYVVDTQGTTAFQQCQPRVCEEPLCAAGCQLVPTADGCPVCQCGPTSCHSNADCAAGDYCDFAAVDAGPPYNGPALPVIAPAGLCEPVVACPAIACAPANPSDVCTTSTDANGCPTCSCQPAGCEADSDCGAGSVCRVLPCNSLECSYQCVPATCLTDADCSSGTTCQPDPTDPCNQAGVYCDALRASTVCLPAPTCSTNADCQSGEVCVENPNNPCQGPEATCDVLLPQICQPAPTP